MVYETRDFSETDSSDVENAEMHISEVITDSKSKLSTILFVYCPGKGCQYRKSGQDATSDILNHIKHNHPSLYPKINPSDIVPKASKHDNALFCPVEGCFAKRSGVRALHNFRKHFLQRHAGMEMPEFAKPRGKRRVSVGSDGVKDKFERFEKFEHEKFDKVFDKVEKVVVEREVYDDEMEVSLVVEALPVKRKHGKFYLF